MIVYKRKLLIEKQEKVIWRSPGVYAREDSFLIISYDTANSPTTNNATIVYNGHGPSNQPIIINNFSEFENIFGGISFRVFGDLTN
jgi:hypothetical protein